MILGESLCEKLKLMWEVDLNHWSLLISCLPMNCDLERNWSGASQCAWLITTSHASHVNFNLSPEPNPLILIILLVMVYVGGSRNKPIFILPKKTYVLTFKSTLKLKVDVAIVMNSVTNLILFIYLSAKFNFITFCGKV